MTLTGKDALDFHESLMRNKREKDAEALARAKLEGSQSGKQPLDLPELQKHVIAELFDRVEPANRVAHWEYVYYVLEPQLRTMSELAECINQTAGY